MCGVASYNPIPIPFKYVNDESMLDESLIAYDDHITHPPFIDPWETYKNVTQEIKIEDDGHREDNKNNNYSNDNNHGIDNKNDVIIMNCNTDCRANHENVNNHFRDSTVCVTVEAKSDYCENNHCAHEQSETNTVDLNKNELNCTIEGSTNPPLPNNNNNLTSYDLHQENANSVILPDESARPGDTTQENVSSIIINQCSQFLCRFVSSSVIF